MTHSYVAVVYPRSGGIYYTVRFVDFDDIRVKNMCLQTFNNPTKRNSQLKNSLKKLIKTWKGPLPESKFKKYDEFTSTYNDEVHYFDVVIPSK